MRSYTVLVSGDQRNKLKGTQVHCYYANGTTAVEVQARDENDAKRIVRSYGFHVTHVFE